jgi:hypothetical protein
VGRSKARLGRSGVYIWILNSEIKLLKRATNISLTCLSGSPNTRSECAPSSGHGEP